MNDVRGGGGLRSGADPEFASNLSHQLQHLKGAIHAHAIEYPDEFCKLPGTPDPDGGDFELEAKNYISRMVDELFLPWKNMADPEMFSNAQSAAEKAIVGLVETDSDTLSKDLEKTTEEVTEAPGDDVVFNPGGSIPQWGSQVVLNIKDWRGATVDSFEKNYASRFNEIHNLQAAVGKVLVKAAEAEAALWKQAQEDIMTIAEESENAFCELDFLGGDGSTSNALTALTTASALTVAIAGPLAPIFTAISAGAAVSKEFVKEDASGTYDLDADHVHTLWYQVEEAVSQARNDVSRASAKINSTLVATYSALASGKMQVGLSGDGDKILVDCMNLLSPPPPSSTGSVDRPLAGNSPF